MDKYSADAFMQSVHHLLSQFQSIAKTAVVRDVLKVQLDVCIAEVEKLAHLIEDNERETYDSDVDVLLALNTFPWDFLNEEVDAFRARAVRYTFIQCHINTSIAIVIICLVFASMLKDSEGSHTRSSCKRTWRPLATSAAVSCRGTRPTSSRPTSESSPIPNRSKSPSQVCCTPFPFLHSYGFATPDVHWNGQVTTPR